ncbi:Homeobox protein Meis2 [Entophlyctis luteolus]|nr:Homeobox protein Meis2 [Entophlyctis luteolus]
MRHTKPPHHHHSPNNSSTNASPSDSFRRRTVSASTATFATPPLVSADQQHNRNAASDGNGNGHAANNTTTSTGGGNSDSKRLNYSPEIRALLLSWLVQNREYPYPDDAAKNELAAKTGLSLQQVNNWFINARRRRYQYMLEDVTPPFHNAAAAPADANAGPNKLVSVPDGAPMDNALVPPSSPPPLLTPDVKEGSNPATSSTPLQPPVQPPPQPPVGKSPSSSFSFTREPTGSFSSTGSGSISGASASNPSQSQGQATSNPHQSDQKPVLHPEHSSRHALSSPSASSIAAAAARRRAFSGNAASANTTPPSHSPYWKTAAESLAMHQRAATGGPPAPAAGSNWTTSASMALNKSNYQQRTPAANRGVSSGGYRLSQISSRQHVYRLEPGNTGNNDNSISEHILSNTGNPVHINNGERLDSNSSDASPRPPPVAGPSQPLSRALFSNSTSAGVGGSLHNSASFLPPHRLETMFEKLSTNTSSMSNSEPAYAQDPSSSPVTKMRSEPPKVHSIGHMVLDSTDDADNVNAPLQPSVQQQQQQDQQLQRAERAVSGSSDHRPYDADGDTRMDDIDGAGLAPTQAAEVGHERNEATASSEAAGSADNDHGRDDAYAANQVSSRWRERDAVWFV